MNHSCCPNTRILTDGSNFFVRTIAKIKAGEELTFSYSHETLSMKNRETRQNITKEELSFVCVCNFCKFGQENQEVIAEFQKLNQDVQKAQSSKERPKLTEIDTISRLAPDMWDSMKKSAKNQKETIIPDLKKEVKCYKDMFNLGKNNKTSWNFSWSYLYAYILLEGFEVALLGLKSALKEEDKEEFKKECEQFSQAAKNIDEMLKTTVVERRKWQHLQTIF